MKKQKLIGLEKANNDFRKALSLAKDFQEYIYITVTSAPAPLRDDYMLFLENFNAHIPMAFPAYQDFYKDKFNEIIDSIQYAYTEEYSNKIVWLIALVDLAPDYFKDYVLRFCDHHEPKFKKHFNILKQIYKKKG